MYHILAVISSGTVTYGRIYKAQSSNNNIILHAIKKLKLDEGDATTYTGISQGAIREIAVSTCDS